MQKNTLSSEQTTIAQLQQIVDEFVEERDWARFHHPKNLAMSIAIEAAELMEHFQWSPLLPSDSNEPSGKPFEPASPDCPVAQEMADVFAYLLRMASVLGIDLARALELKMAMNRVKYPIGVDYDSVLRNRLKAD